MSSVSCFFGVLFPYSYICRLLCLLLTLSLEARRFVFLVVSCIVCEMCFDRGFNAVSSKALPSQDIQLEIDSWLGG